MGRGVLRPDLAVTHFRLARHTPSDALAPFVDYYRSLLAVPAIPPRTMPP